MRYSAAILLAAAVLPNMARGQQLVRVDELPSADYKWCELHDGYLYTAAGSILEIFDPANPANLTKVAQTPAFGTVASPTFVGSYAYVPFGGTVRLLDVSNPAIPVDLGTTVVTHSGAKDNALMRGHKSLVYEPATQRLYYVGSRDFLWDRWGARIYDVTNPEAPALLVEDDTPFNCPTFDETGEIVNHLVIGSRIYVHYNFTVDSSYGNSLQVIDATNPTPGGLQSIDGHYLGGWRSTTAIVSDGSMLYAKGADGLRAYTIESDGTLTLAGTLPLVYPNSIYIEDATTIMVATDSESHFVDVTDPSSMQILATEPVGVEAQGYRARRSGSAVFAPARTSMKVAEIALGSSTTEAPLIGTYQPRSITASGSHIFLGTGNGLWAVDVSSGAFGALYSIDPAGRDETPMVLANGALVQAYFRDLRVYDVVDVANPVLVTTEPNLLGTVYDTASDGDYVAVIGYESLDYKLSLWDLGNPSNPTRKGSEIVPAWSNALEAVELNLPAAYVAHGSDLWVLDCSNVNSPGVVTTIPIGGNPLRIFRTGSLLFASTDLYVYVYDLTDPLNPVQVNDMFLGAAVTAGVAEVDGYHLIAHGKNVWLVDLSDPTSEVFLGQISRRTEGGAIASTGGYAYDLSAFDVIQALDVNVSTGTEPDAGVAGSLLLGAFPNPSRGPTSIRWSPRATGPVSLTIFDVSGRRVREWSSPTGEPYRFEWNGRDRLGQAVARGVYYYRLTAREGSETRRLVKLQ